MQALEIDIENEEFHAFHTVETEFRLKSQSESQSE